MKLPIVDFETAKELKELGFDWGVKYAYNKIGVLWDTGYINNGELTASLRYSYAAPEQALIVKWFRDIHKLSIEPGIFKKGYAACVVRITDGYLDVVIGGSKFNTWPTYEEAELEGIQKTIQYLKNVKT